MNILEFNEKLIQLDSEDELNDFCRKLVLHGTPFVFNGREHDYYEFRKKLLIILMFHFMKFILRALLNWDLAHLRKKNLIWNQI